MNTSFWPQAVRPTVVASLVAVLVLSLLTAAPRPVGAESTFDNVDQVLASTFVEAAVAISSDNHQPGTTDAVVLATDENFPDGLTASAVAAGVGGPVLFTAPDALPEATANEIDRLLGQGQGGTVYVMGGEAAISADVVQALEDAGYTVQRIEGPTRLETAVAAFGQVGVPASGQVIVARAFGPDGANTPSDRATGWVDAISCGAYAAANDIPILLTETDQLSEPTGQALEGSEATDVVICGGSAAVSEDVAAALRELGLDVTRSAGITRVETAIDAAQRLFGLSSAGGNSYTVINGYGENFGFGLAAAPLGNPILLVGTSEPTDCGDQTQPSRETLCYLQTGTADNPAQILLVGSEAIVRDEVSNAVGAAAGGTDLGGETELVPPTDVDATDDLNDNGTRATVTWDAVADPEDILAGYNVYVDGTKVGAATPTVDADTTEFELTGLTEGEEVTVTVTSVDDEDNESEQSEGSQVTPEDEDPLNASQFVASPGNGAVQLSWTKSPSLDLKDYQLQRGTGEDCDAVTYADLAVVAADKTTYTDETAENGTSYCYLLISRDESESSPGVDAGPVEPSELVAGLSYEEPTTTVRYPGPIEIQWTLNPPSGSPSGYNIALAYSVNSGANYFPIVNQSHGSDSAEGSYEWVMPASGADHERLDQNLSNGEFRIRITATPPSGSSAAPSESFSPNLNLSRAPRQVESFAGTAASAAAVLTWDQNPEVATLAGRDGETGFSYDIYRFQRTITPVCPTDVALYGDPIANKPAGEASGGVLTYTDSGLSNGNQLSNPIYCYLVRAKRSTSGGDFSGPASSLVEVDPEAVPGAAVTILDPSDGSVIRQQEPYEMRFKLDNPQSVNLTRIELAYCVDYEQDQQPQPVCQDADGFKALPTRNLSGSEQSGEISHTITIPVTGQGTETGPTNPDQGENTEGAIMATLSAGDSDVGDDEAFGLLFR